MGFMDQLGKLGNEVSKDASSVAKDAGNALGEGEKLGKGVGDLGISGVSDLGTEATNMYNQVSGGAKHDLNIAEGGIKSGAEATGSVVKEAAEADVKAPMAITKEGADFAKGGMDVASGSFGGMMSGMQAALGKEADKPTAMGGLARGIEASMTSPDKGDIGASVSAIGGKASGGAEKAEAVADKSTEKGKDHDLEF